jgi:hypothetical protein
VLNGGRAGDSQQSAGKFLAALLHTQGIQFLQLLDHRATQNTYIYSCYPNIAAPEREKKIQMKLALNHS